MAPADSSPVAAFRPSASDVYFHVVCKWKDCSKDENGKHWVEEKTVVGYPREGTRQTFCCETE